MSIDNFLSFCETNKKNAVLVMFEAVFNNSIKEHYKSLKYNDSFLHDSNPLFNSK